MDRRRLPIGIQTFREIREEDCYYVDKTPLVHRLVSERKHYFLSRPRRFGKSLLLDTIKELFEGNEALFEGLHIHDRWDWSVRHPVVRLSFGGGHFTEPGHLEANLLDQLAGAERRTGLGGGYHTAPGRLAALLEALHTHAGQRAVVLVDEYDKPILDALEVPEVARANRDYLRGLYGVIKDCDAHIRFSFLTGVSKFSKVNLFSGLNNLRDITLDPRYSTICGYTEADLDTVFAPELPGLDRAAVREWYNGYAWLGEEKVYNPFDILLLFDRRELDAYWFETGTPTFLVETLFKRRITSVSLDGMLGSNELLSAFDVDAIGTEAHRLAGDRADILADYAEAEALLLGYRFQGDPARRLERALEIDPRHPKSLWLAGFAALQSARPELALERWDTLLAIVEAGSEQARMLAALIDRTREEIGAAVPGVAAAEDDDPGPVLLVTVNIEEHLRDDLDGNESLFVYARSAGGPPAPLVARRESARDFPLTLRLDDSMSMLPGRTLAGAERVEVGARISRSGDARASSGDIQGMSEPIEIRPGRTKVEVLLNDRVP